MKEVIFTLPFQQLKMVVKFNGVFSVLFLNIFYSK